MRFFVTGISGFAGTHLTSALLERGDEVVGMSRERSRPLDDLHARFAGRFPSSAVEYFDIRDAERLRAAVREAAPDGVFHLAGLSFVPQSIAEPDATYEVNFFGTVRLLEAVRDHARRARVVCVTTSQVYGALDARADLPITEEQPLRPLTPYGVAKAAADLAAYQFFRAERLDVIRVRPFNYTGPGQSSQFVCSEFARAFAAAERGAAPAKFRVGDLRVERDFSDVRDVVRAYLALFERGVAGEAYNTGSGSATSVAAILDELGSLSRAPLAVEPDPAKIRPNDIPRIVASIAKLGDTTGWRPEIPLRRTLGDLLDFWRGELARAE